VLVLAGALLARAAHAGSPSAGLTGLERVSVRVEASADVAALAPPLEQRVADALRQAPRPAPRLDAAGQDVLRLTVAVQAIGSRALRGFYLPFSGTYAIGPVRLALLRPAKVGGGTDVVATVWEAERQAAGPWREVATAMTRLTDELVAAFLDTYRAAAR
jgi:hypothetical protein